MLGWGNNYCTVYLSISILPHKDWQACSSHISISWNLILMRSRPCLPKIKSSMSATTPIFPSFRSLVPSGNLARNGILTWFNKIKMNGSCQGRVQINSGQVVKKIILIQFLLFDLFLKGLGVLYSDVSGEYSFSLFSCLIQTVQ